MREAICIHIGQAGVQIGNACWELFCILGAVLWLIGRRLAFVQLMELFAIQPLMSHEMVLRVFFA